MAADPISAQFAEYQRLAREYHASVKRCLKSLDQLRAAERELSQDGDGLSLAPIAEPDWLSELTALDFESLSDREFEVFALIGAGLSSRQIAERLRLSISTVETYRERLKEKLKLDNGHALTRVATIWALSYREPSSDGHAGGLTKDGHEPGKHRR